MDKQHKAGSKSFGVKSLLRGLYFTQDEISLLTMDKRELEAMKRFGVDRETFRSVQATELDRYVCGGDRGEVQG